MKPRAGRWHEYRLRRAPNRGRWRGLQALWDEPAPRTPLQFLQLERRVCAAAGRQADEILGHHLIGAHQDAAFVEQAVEAARQRHDGVLRHKGQRTTSVWLPGGALCVVETPYLRPQTPRRPGRKRTRRGPTGAGVYPVLEALGIAHRVSPATRSQMALYTVQAGSYQEAVQLLAEQGVPVDVTTLRRVAQSTARADIALRDGALAQARRTPVAADGPLAGLRVRVSIDGGRVRTRSPHPGRRTKKGRHRFDTPWREPRVLLIDVLDRNGRADPLRRPLYDTLLEDAEATRALIIGYLRLLGAAHAQRGVFIADGAEWIWERSDQIRQEAEIPTRRWVEGVDFYHASEHLHDAIELGRDRNASERRQQYERLRHVLRRDADGVHKVIEALQSRSARPAGSEDEHGHRLLRTTPASHGLRQADSSEGAGGIGACGERHPPGHQPALQSPQHVLGHRNRRRPDAFARRLQVRALARTEAPGPHADLSRALLRSVAPRPARHRVPTKSQRGPGKPHGRQPCSRFADEPERPRSAIASLADDGAG